MSSGGHTEFHEESHGRGCARAAIGPEDDIVRVGIASALEEIEEQVSSLDIYVARIRAARNISSGFVCLQLALSWAPT